MYTLFTDSDCEFTPELCEKFGIKMISMPYNINGKDIYPYVSWKDYNDKEFFDILRGGVLPTTCALSPEEYKAYFEPEFAKGNDILYVHFSAAMSATFNSMRLALEDLKEKYPDRKVETIDTKGITLVSYVECYEIFSFIKENPNASIGEIKAYAEDIISHTACYFFADDLKFFAKSGRVGGFSAFMGGIIGIKPIIYMSDQGKMEAYGKAKGRKGAIDALVMMVEKLQLNIKDYMFSVAHGDAMELVDLLIEKLKDKFGDDLKIDVHPVNPTAGSHCGPNTVGVCFHAIHK